MSLRALGGGLLDGDNFVRHVYMDEAGTGNEKREQFLVVGGLIVDCDRHLKRIEGHLYNIARDCGIEGSATDAIFHAYEIFDGSSRLFKKELMSQEARLKILRAICQMPSKFDLPVVLAAVDRTETASTKGFASLSLREKTAQAQALSSLACALEVEKYMRSKAVPKGELATLIYENTDTKKRIRELHNTFKDKDIDKSGLVKFRYSDYVPMKRVSEQPYFGEKAVGSPLLVIDALVFVAKRTLQKKPIAGKELYSLFRAKVLNFQVNPRASI